MVKPTADVVIVAAGSSRRMGGLDKLDAPLAGRPVLRWTVEALVTMPRIEQVIVVTTPQRVEALGVADWTQELGLRLVTGGPRRQDSVVAGIRESRAEVVLVHDAARPFVSAEVVERVIAGVVAYGAAIPVLPVVDALKRVGHEGLISGSAERAGLFRAQTPQGARRELLLSAAEAHAGDPAEIKDEAELLALDGVSVATVAGDIANIKVTEPADLALARRLANEALRPRVTHGADSHPFGAAYGLRLGGIEIAGAPRLHGHSDGDVVLHALGDALLAACGAGDLGRLFPSGEDATRGIDSLQLLAAVMAQVSGAGLRVDSADITILGARPRIGAQRLDIMARTIARALGAEPTRVSVKAATGNLSGDEGAGRVISASCLVSVVPR